MFEYEFGGNQFTKKDVEDRAAEKGLSVEAYLATNPQITKIDLGKQKGTTTQDETMVSDTESTSEDGLLEQVALESPGDLTSWIDKNFFDKTEEEAVSQLTIALEDTGFKVTESGKFFPFDEATKNDPRANQRMGLANFVEVEAPNGEKLLIETAISSSGTLALEKKGKEGLEKYYADLESDLKNFIEINSDFSVKAKQKLKENRVNNRKLYIGFQDAVKLTDDQAEEIELEFPDISIFDTYTTRKVVGVGRPGTGVDLKFSSGKEKVVTETIQPYEKELALAKSELGEDATKTEIKEKALQILRENSTEEIVKANSTSIIDQLQDGEIPPSLEEEFDNYTFLNYDNLKSYITIGSKQYSEDYVAVMNGVVNSKVKLEEKELAIQDILDKKVYTKQDIADYEIARQDYNQQVSDYNATLELYSQFATIDIEDINTQLSLLQKNYDFWEKQSTNVALNFRDFASRASYGLSSFIGADGHLPDADNPDMTREEVRTLKLNKILDQSNIIKSSYEDDVAFENAFGSFENFMKWSVNMANTQLPILASLAVPGGWSALLANSFGENYSQMTLEEMEAKADAEGFGQSYEEKGKFNKWGTSLLYAAPEVILDRLTTGVRVRGVMDMFKASGDELIDITAKDILTDVAYGIPTDATMGALSEGTTQIWQNWITGKDDLTEGFAEAAFSGLLMDGSLSAMPTLKAAAVMQFTDQNKLKEVRELQTQIDQLYTLQSSAFGSDLKQDIKDLEAQKEAKIKEINDSVIGIGALGLTNSAVEQYTELTSEKAKLKNRAKQILDNNLLTKEQKQKQLVPLKAQYDAIKQVQDQYKKEKGTEFNMFVANSKNKAEVDKLYADAKAKFAREGKTDPTEIQIKDQARIDYNVKKIEKDIISKGKKGKLDEKLLVVRSEKDIDNIKNKEGEAISAAVLNTIKEAYASGDGGVNIQGESIEGDKTSLIFVENMAKDDRLEVRTHELYHELTKQALLNDKTLFDGMAYTIENWAKANDTELYNRLQRQVQRKNGKLVADEVIANFMEEVAANRVKLKDEKNRGLLSIFTFGASKAMKDKYGIKFEIAGVTDSFELMYGLAKKISKGTITEADIAGLSESEAIVTLKEQGKQIQEQYLFATQEDVKKASKVQAKIDNLGNKYTREQWQASGADQTIAEIYDDLAALVGSKAFMLERLPNFSKEDFITDAIGELIPHIRNFNIDRKKTDQGFGLSGWINSQLMNKIGNVLKKKTATSETFTVDEDAETFREQVETADDLATFEEEDLSLQAQLRQRQRAEELAEKGEQEGVEYSEFRRQLEFNGQKGISDSMKKAIEKITLDILSSSKYINLDVNALEKTLQRDFEVAIKKSIQDAMGGQNDYVEFLAKNKDIILKYMDISSLVAIERQVSTEDKILTKFVRRLTTQQDVQDAVDNGWLSHIDNPAQGPNLYKVLNPSTSEFLKFYNPPLRVDSPKKVKQWDAMPDAQKQTLADNMGISLEQARTRFVEVRSGLKGTRKDTLAERIAGQLAFDATMQVIQSPQFASIREAAGMPVVAQSRIKEIARKIDRGIEVKFAGKPVSQAEISLAYKITEVSDGNLYSDKLGVFYSGYGDERKYFVKNKAVLERLKKESMLRSENTIQTALGIAYEVMASDYYRSQRITDPTTRKQIYLQALSDKVKNIKSTPNSIFEQIHIDDVYKYAKSNNVKIVRKATEKDDAPDVYFYVGTKKEGVGFGIEVKMGLSKGTSVTLRPFRNSKGEWYFVNKKQNETEAYNYDFLSDQDKQSFDKLLNETADALNRFEKDHNIKIDFDKGISAKDYKRIFTDGGYTKSLYSIRDKYSLSPSITGAMYAEKKITSGLITIEDRGVFMLPTSPVSQKDKVGEAAEITTQVVAEFKRLTGKTIPLFTTQLDTQLEFRTGKPRINKGRSRSITIRFNQAIDNNNIDKSPINLVNDGEMITKAISNVLNAKMTAKVGKSSDRAIEAARLTNNKTKPVGMSAFDFDETLIIDGENFVVATKGKDVVKISSGKWPIDGPRLAREGYKFDFSDFVNVRGGVDGPLMKDFKKKLAKYGAENMFILTARPQEADKAIHGWLKSKGINIPLNNITGLGNSTGEAKAQWMLDKFAEGYNDMYFVDDALPNVKAVKHVLSQLDIKSDVQQAKIKFASKMSATINEMIERSRGIPTEEVISRAISKRRGKNKNRFQVFIPPSADDFLGLMYYIIGEGKQGEADFDFIKKSLVDPFSRAYTELDAARQTILNDLDKLNKNYRDVYKKLGDTMPNSEFTFDNAIRVYLFNKHGHTIPGVSNEEVASLVGRVNADMELLVYAETLDMLSKTEEYLEPGEAWTAGSIVGDINRIVEGVHRKTFLGEWIENKNEIFSEENLNKLEAAYGTSYRSALEDILYRMETGISRPTGPNKITNQWTNWLNNSVGAIMFFNSKSALLQTISTVNYLNFDDNNIFKAAKAFANQKQYWADFTFIFNSDFLKQRRSGLKTDVSQSEIASAVAGATNKAKAAIAYLLKIGFLPTQAADSFAISAGGATFYRNRINKYLAEGKTQKEAQEQAFIDFREISEESQQSARPDRVSQQQTTNAGRLILAFQNAPMQFNRIIKKAALDLINKRGDWRSNTSRIIYYGGIQSLIFLTLQNALFALAFDDEDENKNLTVKELQKKEKFQQTKYDRIVNGMVDTLLRGSGITGAVISTLKNTVLKFMSEAEKGKRMNEASILTEALQISPQIGSKARKIISGVRAYKWDGEAIPLMSKFNTKNPLWLATAPVVEGLTNVPLNRLITKVNNLREAANSENAPWQRAGVALGWSAWDLGVDTGAEVDELIKEDKKKKQAKKKRCKRITSKGTRCKNTFTGPGKFCYAHD